VRLPHINDIVDENNLVLQFSSHVMHPSGWSHTFATLKRFIKRYGI
jgi:hypothetical protein